MPGFSFPQDFPLERLIGQEVTQICIGSHDIRINFYKVMGEAGNLNKWESGASIDIETGFIFQIGDSPALVSVNETLGENAGCLTRLLRQWVVSTDRLQDNQLVLRFSNKSELKLLVDEQGFESYHLQIDGKTIDVTKPW